MERITVKSYMTKKATPEFDFMAKWNNDNPMPLRTMIGTVEKETRGMVYMKLHGDIYAKQICTCMKCGRPLTNPVSQFFGIGPECGGHNYVNPFNSDEELNEAVSKYRAQLQNITWEGWIIKSAITEGVTFESADDAPKATAQQKIDIKVDIRESDRCNGEQSAFISFPYNETVLNIIRALPSRYWNAEKKEWEVPVKSYQSLKFDAEKFNVIVTGTIISKVKEEVDTLPVDFEYKTIPFAHQIAGFEYGLTHDRWLLGDEQGLGKTKQVIDIAVAKKLQKNYKHCLIICGVNGLKWNWVNEIHTHSNENAFILGQKTLKNRTIIGSNADKLADLKNIAQHDEYFIITNVESIRDEAIANELQKLCRTGVIGLAAIDEVHKCKNPSSQQGKGIMKIQPECRIAMTGTPLMNTPLDLYIILKWLGYEKHSYYSFKNHYCVMGGYGGYQIVSYKYLDELQSQLEDIMLRRLKKDVLDLPEKTYINEYVDMTAKQEQIYREVTAEIKANIDQIKLATNPLAQLIRMRQATGYTGILSSTIKESAKLDRMEELVEEAVDNGKKVVIFSNWTQMTDAIVERLHIKGYYPAVITGQITDEFRQEQVNKFQNNDKCKVIVGTVGAMGTGLTLTAGTVEIFMDEPWNRANKEQAEDRCHRVGTTENVTIYTLICKNTIDERINELVYRKGVMADAIVDGKTTLNNSELLDFLLS